MFPSGTSPPVNLTPYQHNIPSVYALLFGFKIWFYLPTFDYNKWFRHDWLFFCIHDKCSITVEINANKSSLRQAKARFYCILFVSLPAIHTCELAFSAFPQLSFCLPHTLVSFHLARIGLVLVPCCSACVAIADTNRGHKKTSLRVFKRALRLPLLEHEER